MTRLFGRLPLIALAGAFAIGLLIVRNWAYVTTYRLYLSQRVDADTRSTATQRFDIEGASVVPQIVMRDDDLVAFKLALGQTSRLYVGLRPADRARYEIRWRQNGSTAAVLATGEAVAATTLVLPFRLSPASSRFSAAAS